MKGKKENSPTLNHKKSVDEWEQGKIGKKFRLKKI